MKLDGAQQTRFRKTAAKGAAGLGAGIAYYIFIRLTNWPIPCLISLWIPGNCPGCGVTRMFLALGALDLPGAFHNNALILCMLPVFLIFGGRHWLRYVKTGDREMDGIEKALILITSVLTAAFWILRNLPAFSFLAPI